MYVVTVMIMHKTGIKSLNTSVPSVLAAKTLQDDNNTTAKAD